MTKQGVILTAMCAGVAAIALFNLKRPIFGEAPVTNNYKWWEPFIKHEQIIFRNCEYDHKRPEEVGYQACYTEDLNNGKEVCSKYGLKHAYWKKPETWLKVFRTDFWGNHRYGAFCLKPGMDDDKYDISKHVEEFVSENNSGYNDQVLTVYPDNVTLKNYNED